MPPGGTPRRYFEVVFRYKWLILLVTIAGTALGALWTRTLIPLYDVHATVWLSAETPQTRNTGPIRPEQLLNTTSWPDLLGSFAILDSVARKSRLYISPDRGAPASVFANFEIGDHLRPGSYQIRVDPTTRRYDLIGTEHEAVEHGAIGDSIGRRLGFKWAPAAESLLAHPVIRFGITTPRDAAIVLRSRLGINLPRESSMLRLTLRGSDPRQTTETMTALLSQFVATASRLKTRNLVEFANTLEQQLNYAAQEMRTAEIALEEFRVRTITLPSEGGGTIAAGLEMTRDPVLRHYFDQKLQLDSVRSDRQSLERTMGAITEGHLAASALWSVPAVHATKELADALTQFAAEQSALRTSLQFYTDQHKSVIDLRARVAQLQQQTIPTLVTALLDNLRRREQDLQNRVDGSSRELRQIPTRTIEEMRLRRNVDVRQQLYTTLRGRYEEARLGEASALPDLSILDYPALPGRAVANTASRIIALAVAASLGAGLVLALLLDRLDRRFMYPEQATQELGLDIVGVVPRIRPARADRARAEQAWQVTESFRAIRLGVSPWQEPGSPMQLAISSPGSGDGKSLVAANLACSFANAGLRTVLIDGDVRRGMLHAAFGLPGRPGLTEYLAGHIPLHEVLRPTGTGLTVISAGSRGARAPELLASQAMTDLLTELRRRYDVILLDSAPLNAGVDAFVLGALATNLVLVLRAGVTDRKLAEAKLRMIDRLPIRLVGAVLNGVQTKGAYRYYSYRYNDEPIRSAGVAQVAAPMVE